MTKHRLPLALATAAATLAVAVSPAHALAEFARGKLTVAASLNTAYDSNIFANSTEEEDVSVTFNPSLAWTRNAGRISATVSVGISAITFTDADDQDSVDPSINAALTHDRAEKGSDSVSLSYTRSSEANDILLDRVEVDNYRGSVGTDYFYSEKTGFRANANFRSSLYDAPGFNDVESYGLGGGILYRYSPKLVANATYSFSPEKAEELAPGRLSDPSSKNHRFSLGLEGELAPKLSGNVSVGYAYRDFDNGADSDDTILVGAGLSWAAAEKTTLTLSATQDFDTTANAESAHIFNVSLGARHTLTEKISLNASLGYQQSELDEVGTPVSREDDTYIFGAGSSYRINDNISANLAVRHRINDSTLARAEYDRTVVSLGLNLLY